MAILQSRMIALINAALDYQHALEQLIQMIHRESRNIELGNQTAEGAMQNLTLQANDILLLDNPSLSQTTISQEHYHFKRHAKRNEQERKYQERRRHGITTKEHFEPRYATTEFSVIAHKSAAFRAPGQNVRGDIPKQTYEPREPSVERKWEIENRPPSDLTLEQENEYKAFLRRRDEEARRRYKDPFKSTGEKDETEL